MRSLDFFNSKPPSKALAYNAHLHIQDISNTNEAILQGENNNQISYRKPEVRNNSIDGKYNTGLDGTKYKESSIRNVRSLPAIYYRQ